MIARSLIDRLRPVLFALQRSVTLQTDLDLGARMKSFNDRKQFKQALDLFDQYKQENVATFSSMIITQALKACAQTGDLQRGSTIHHLISSRARTDSYILASLIHLYSKIVKKLSSNSSFFSAIIEVHCGDVRHAQSLFDTSTKKTLSMYGAMMKGAKEPFDRQTCLNRLVFLGYIKNHLTSKAIDLFYEIEHPDDVILMLFFNACAYLENEEGLSLIRKVTDKLPRSFLSNSRRSTALFDALIKCGDCSSAHLLFPKVIKSVTSYGNLMNGLNKEDRPEKTLHLFNQMKIEKIEPNDVIYLCVIKAASQIADYSISQSIMEQIPNSILTSDRIANVLIDMWGKTGCVDKAKEVFDKISQPDQIGYTAMINAYGLNGMGIQAIELYNHIPAQLVDEAAHVCVLNACSHSGLIKEARSIFENTPTKTGKIYTTMIDCLSRASLFREAQILIDEFESHHSPIWPMYMALLSGARNEKNADLASNVYERMKTLFPELTDSLTAAAVLLANLYGSTGNVEKASDIRIQMSKSGVRKKAGVSCTVVNGQIYKFRAHDQSHPRSSEIYQELSRISKELLEHGHQYDSSWITRSLSQNETVASVLCGHSERLAIAWNFVANPNTSRIQITKNLRVCGDCHRATKLIATIRQCEIVVRDANRIHHFHKSGQCSCNDYF